MNSNFGRSTDHFVIFAYVSRTKIDQNINYEHNINCKKQEEEEEKLIIISNNYVSHYVVVPYLVLQFLKNLRTQYLIH